VPGKLFQFPLHRDPRCNFQKPESEKKSHYVSVPFTSGSSLQLLVLEYFATTPEVSVPFTSGSSLQQKIAEIADEEIFVSVPFTSGSSLQLGQALKASSSTERFSSLYIGILAATEYRNEPKVITKEFQFPLHRDPRCNRVLIPYLDAEGSFSSLYIGILAATCSCGGDSSVVSMFQFPLHRDPRCNPSNM